VFNTSRRILFTMNSSLKEHQAEFGYDATWVVDGTQNVHADVK
jgi:hypothetical protein